MTGRHQMRSISDDDLCSDCSHCVYDPGELSACSQGWPGRFDADGPRQGYCTTCPQFVRTARQGDNWRHQQVEP